MTVMQLWRVVNIGWRLTDNNLFAIVSVCTAPKVCVAKIFDQKLSHLFVVCVAGNVLGPWQL